MNMKKAHTKIIVASLALSMVTSNAVGVGNNYKIKAESVQTEANYIVQTVSQKNTSELEQKYDKSLTVNDNGEELSEDNNMISLKMTAEEAKKLETSNTVVNVEKDAIVSACSESKVPHQKKVKTYKKNTKKSEWNMQMIHADGKKKKSKNKIKVAVLDSGVDYGNDIDLSYSVTLVPGEEEMNLLFMDGTGHGNSVAGLIAACDNKEGITGVNPNAEIYSIRVLDDNNQAPISRIVEGIYMAMEQKVNIINMSFGISQYSEALHQAIKDASDAGILLIAAAGNTGDKGVQYPAAFEEVMAVGSVDKHGDVVESSAKGEEVEIVAPGELVKSTGEFGNVRVSSGTSLAAPQVAGVASLLWEKNDKLTSETIRTVIAESANLYGQKEEYGKGLLDVEEALTCCEQAKAGTTMDDDKIEKNEKAVLSFKDTGCVEGSWSDIKHGDMIPSDYTVLKKGARFPDVKEAYCREKNDLSTCIFGRMTYNPWWHGYYRQENPEMNKCNYIAAYIYATRWANKETNKKFSATIPYGLNKEQAKNMRDGLKVINWNKEAGSSSPKDKRNFIWGMALHTLADAFAHSTFYKGKQITHVGGSKDADNSDYLGRYDCAKEAVKKSITRFEKGANYGGTADEFSPAKNSKGFKMANIYDYYYEVTSSKERAASYSKYSQKAKTSK
ncbi:MAG: S8 family peptidase [Eubacterium sp.]|nr:S8 family peptidase [Eubacterium sp.]